MILCGLIVAVLSISLYLDFSDDLTVRTNPSTADDFYAFAVAIVVWIILYKVYSKLTIKPSNNG